MVNKVRTVFENISWMLISQIIASILAFIWTILTAQYLGPSDYGIFGTAISFSSLFLVIADFGIGTYIIRSISTDLETESKYINNAFSLSLFLSLLYLSHVCFFAYLVPLPHSTVLYTISRKRPAFFKHPIQSHIVLIYSVTSTQVFLFFTELFTIFNHLIYQLIQQHIVLPKHKYKSHNCIFYVTVTSQPSHLVQKCHKMGF